MLARYLGSRLPVALGAVALLFASPTMSAPTTSAQKPPEITTSGPPVALSAAQRAQIAGKNAAVAAHAVTLAPPAVRSAAKPAPVTTALPPEPGFTATKSVSPPASAKVAHPNAAAPLDAHTRAELERTRQMVRWLLGPEMSRQAGLVKAEARP